MSNPQPVEAEFDSFFVNEKQVSQTSHKNQELQKSIDAELQNSDITEKQNNDDTELQKVRKPKKQKVPKRDDPSYQRVTVSILRKKIKKIKDYMWEKKIKNFDDALELFISDEPLK